MKPACHCADFSRTAMLRRAVAEAGRGLPGIEPGMPLPAGTGLDRRTFLARSLGLVLAVYGAGRLDLPGLSEGVARAAENGAADGRVLVSVFLEGGADSLSILFPAGDPRYRRLRPKLALAESAGATFAEDDRLRWHPAAAGLGDLDGEGKVTVLPAIGYAHPDQSHFTSRHFWEVGATDSGLRTGWLGRYLDLAGTADNPLQGLSLDGRLAPALAAASVPVAGIDGPGEYDFWAAGVWGDVEKRMLEALGSLGGRSRGTDPALALAGDVALRSASLRQALAPFAPEDGKPAFTSPVSYPRSDDGFPKRLAGLAAMLGAGLPIRCAAVSAPGQYDTHSGQPGALADGLALTTASLVAFQRDLEARGLADRVLVHVWSEFGRRAKENGSLGTDHGAAGIGFLIGSQVGGRMIGEFPGLADGLDEEGNLRPTADFRGLYAALLEQWLGVEAAAVLPGADGLEQPRILR